MITAQDVIDNASHIQIFSRLFTVGIEVSIHDTLEANADSLAEYMNNEGLTFEDLGL